MTDHHRNAHISNPSDAPSSMSSYTMGSLFSGIGGFCLAFKACGFDILWANEIDPPTARTYERNFPEARLLEKPIEKLSVDKDEIEPVDVVTAGFPCQPFSVAGDKSGFNDPRGRLIFHVSRLLKEFGDQRPKIVLLENVKHLLKHDKGRTFAKIVSEIQTAGYWFRYQKATVLNTKEQTRIPQNRERLFMVAFNWDIFPKNDFVFPEPEEGIDQVSDYLDLDHKAEDNFYFDEKTKYGKLFAESMAIGNADSVYQLRRYYVRENKSNSVFTLTANMGDGGHNVPVIKDRWGIRQLTPTECARLQGFWESEFTFPEDITIRQRYKQIGNTVTVPLVKKLAIECKRHLDIIEGKLKG